MQLLTREVVGVTLIKMVYLGLNRQTQDPAIRSLLYLWRKETLKTDVLEGKENSEISDVSCLD